MTWSTRESLDRSMISCAEKGILVQKILGERCCTPYILSKSNLDAQDFVHKVYECERLLPPMTRFFLFSGTNWNITASTQEIRRKKCSRDNIKHRRHFQVELTL